MDKIFPSIIATNITYGNKKFIDIKYIDINLDKLSYSQIGISKNSKKEN